jgi:hypothetical protein
VLGASDRPHADLREARRLALKVRDDKRLWRGDSGPAVAAAIEAALHAGNLQAAIETGTSDGDATPREAAHPDVVARVAVALAVLGRDTGLPDVSGLGDYERERVLAQSARSAGRNPEPHWRAALAAAVDESEQATALAGLASTGTLDLPGLAEFEAAHPQVAAQIRGTGELARGEHHEVVERFRGRAGDDAQSSLLLARAYEMSGQVDAAVETLDRAAARFAHPDLAFQAAMTLHSAGRTQEAAALANRLLASASVAWPCRARALHFAAKAAAEEGTCQAPPGFSRRALRWTPPTDRPLGLRTGAPRPRRHRRGLARPAGASFPPPAQRPGRGRGLAAAAP